MSGESSKDAVKGLDSHVLWEPTGAFLKAQRYSQIALGHRYLQEYCIGGTEVFVLGKSIQKSVRETRFQ